MGKLTKICYYDSKFQTISNNSKQFQTIPKIMNQNSISIDIGNKVTGYVVYKQSLSSSMKIDVIDLGVYDVDDSNGNKDITSFISNLVDKYNISYCIYENTFMYKNWNLLRLQKRLSSFCKGKNIRTRSLLPSQKYGHSNERRRKRKNTSVNHAHDILKHPDKNSIIYEKFINTKRNHDIADALMMAIYDANHPK